MNKIISIVIPCYNESQVLRITNERLEKIFIELKLTYELIYVDDGSKDDTGEIIESLTQKNKNIRLIKLSRNFGHQIAVTAGIDSAEGDAVIIIDADLQDPPELIPEMVNMWKKGADVVYGVRKVRKGESYFKLITANLFYKIIEKLSETEIPKNTGDFRLIDRKIVEIFKKMPEKDRFIRGMISWIGFNQVPLYYDREKRLAGETKYPITKMVALALDGIISFSRKPLKVALYIGITLSFLSFIGIIYALISRLFGNAWVPGWTLLIMTVLLLGGFQMIFLGLIGEYIGRIYNESKNRPLYSKYKESENS
jgi:dolichol-phosphate mannosyltransferase